MSQKKSVNIIVLITAVFITGIGVYFAWNRQSPSLEPVLTSTPAPIQNPADWQTYRSEKYAFQLQYPTAWKVESQYETDWKGSKSPYSAVIASPDFREVDQTKAEVLYNPPPIEKGGKLWIRLSSISNIKSMSWEQYVKEQSYNNPIQIQTINNLKLIYFKSEYPMNSKEFRAHLLYPFSPKNTTYELVLTLQAARAEEKQYEDIFSHIISSLNFINSEK
jgi:hypothetical protein